MIPVLSIADDMCPDFADDWFGFGGGQAAISEDDLWREWESVIG
jgi:hypothetical protein